MGLTGVVNSIVNPQSDPTPPSSALTFELDVIPQPTIPLGDANVLQNGVTPNLIAPQGNPPSSRAPYPGNTGQESGSDLANQFTPDNATAQQLFGRVQSLQPLSTTTSPPTDRFVSNYANYGDVGFQQEAQKLVDQGVIGPGTFVLSDTGHDIPMMQTLMSQLDMSGALALPNYNPNEPGNGTRVAAQAQTWGNEIAQLDQENSADGQVSSYFLGIDGHRSDAGPLDASKLPTAEQLRAAGVTKIVYLAEASPGQLSLDNVSGDVEGYLRDLEAAGIEVDVRGVDYRQVPGRDAGF